MAEDSPRANEFPIREMTKTLTRSGGGSGVSLHFDTDFATQFDLNPGTELTVKAVEVDGDVKYRIEGIPTGFTIDEFQEYAEMKNWNKTKEPETTAKSTQQVYQDPSKQVRITMRSPGHVGDLPINNITVEGPSIPIKRGSEGLYQEMLATAQQKGLDTRVNDSKGLWQQLRASESHPTDETPDLETLEQIVEQADEVTVKFIWTARSVETTKEHVGDAVNDIKDGMDGLNFDSHERDDDSEEEDDRHELPADD